MGGPSRYDRNGPVTTPERHPAELVFWGLVGLALITVATFAAGMVLLA